MLRVAVRHPDGSPAMPTKASRARRWVRQGKATEHWNDAGVYVVQLIDEPSGRATQPIALGIDPGKLYTGIGIQSAKATLYRAHLVLPFPRVKERMGAALVKHGKAIQNVRGRALQRRVRRSRRIDRSLPFEQRAHRQKRFDNRGRCGKLAPSIQASRQMELRVVRELMQVYPISVVVYEVVRAREIVRVGEGFQADVHSGRDRRRRTRSQQGCSATTDRQDWCVEQLSQLAPVRTQVGSKTAEIRKYLGLAKGKTKQAQTPESHANDGVALAASQFVQCALTPGAPQGTYSWHGTVEVTPSMFRAIARPAYFRRALHFDNPVKGGDRRRKGGTTTPFGYRAGDKVAVTTKGTVITGWVGGYTNTTKSKKVSVYDHNWKRLGQFGLRQIQLLRRANKLCVA